MKTIFNILLLLGISLLVQSQNKSQQLLEARNETLVSISQDDFKKIPNSYSYSIHALKQEKVILYINSKQYEALNSLQIPLQTETIPSMENAINMSETIEQALSWDSYPDYETYLALMDQFHKDFPSLCEIDTIGFSTQGRLLLAIKITNKESTISHKPNFLYTSSMHGDELAGYVLSLRLIDYLLNQNASNIEVSELLNKVEIYINPLANPDGTFAEGNHTVYGATRGNANGIDINRNFPDPDKGEHPDEQEWQAETIAMMEYMKKRGFEMAVNFHGGAEVINYPWDTWSKLHADNDWYNQICRNYADTVHAYSSDYLLGEDNGVTNGYAWYTVAGGRQDYSNYFIGTRELLIELSETKLPEASQLPELWEYNYRSLVQYITNVNYGIKGLVKDQNGNPIAAQISVVSHDIDQSEIRTDDKGVFYRYLTNGTYDIEISAYGFETTTLKDITVSMAEQIFLEIEMKAWPVDIPNSLKEQLGISIYPNPSISNKGFQIGNTTGRLYNYRLYASNGQLIDLGASELKSITLSKNLEPGVYFIKIIREGNTYTEKITVY